MPNYGRRRRYGGGRKYGARGGLNAYTLGRAISSGFARGQQSLDYQRQLLGELPGTRYFKRRPMRSWPVGSVPSLTLFGGPDPSQWTEAQRKMRRLTGFRGSGGYWGRLAGRWLGNQIGMGNAGAALGDRLGDLAADAIGPGFSRAADIAGSMVQKYAGRGAYVTNDIVAGGTIGSSAIPEFAQTSDGGITVSSKEYVADVFAPRQASAFANMTFPINPGMEKTFPWLCQLAENYDEYELVQCIFTYKSTVADFASTSGQVGQVIMATQYNSAQAPFADKQTMMQYAYACSGKTSQDMLQGVECDPSKLSGPAGRFVRNGPVPAGYFGDINNYDHAVLNLAVTDCPATYAGQQMGELWVSYTVNLRKPKFVTAMGWGISRDYFCNRTNASVLSLFGTAAAPSVLAGQQNSIGSSILAQPYASNNAALVDFPGAAFVVPNLTTSSYLVGGADQVVFAIVLPSTYSGNLIIKLLLNGNSGGYTSAQVYPWWPSTCGIKNINDIMKNDDTFGASTTLDPNPNQSAAVACHDYEFHVRVTTPVNGVPNVIFFAGASSLGPGTVTATQVDISEYNTLFNYKQDGTNDGIVLVNSGGVVTP